MARRLANGSIGSPRRAARVLLAGLCAAALGCGSEPGRSAGIAPGDSAPGVVAAAERPDVVLPAGTSRRSGLLLVGRLTVPAGSVLEVVGDLRIVASGPVVIDGVVRAVSPEAAELGVDAPSIEIVSESSIRVQGSLLGARGGTSTGEDRAGGKGSTLRLTAPVIQLSFEELRGGPGGDARRGHGGTGGDAFLSGRLKHLVPGVGLSAVPGPGGRGGGGRYQDGHAGGAAVNELQE